MYLYLTTYQTILDLLIFLINVILSTLIIKELDEKNNKVC